MWLGASPFRVTVSGQGWGLCCNAVHYIELFDALTGRTQLRMAETKFHEGWLVSKRDGYREIEGGLCVESAHGDALELSCSGGAPEEAIHIHFFAGNRTIRADFFADRLECRYAEGDRFWEESFRIPMQSQLTHHHIHELMLCGDCALPRLERSTLHHLLVLKPFLEHFRKFDPALGAACPVT